MKQMFFFLKLTSETERVKTKNNLHNFTWA